MPFPHSFPFPLGAFYEQDVKVAVKSSTKRKYGFLRIVTPLLGMLSSFAKKSSWHKKFASLEGILASFVKVGFNKRRITVKIGVFKILNLLRSINMLRYKNLSLGLKTTRLSLLNAIRIIFVTIGFLTQIPTKAYNAIRYRLMKLGINVQDIDVTYHHLIYVFIRHFDIFLGALSIQSKLAYSLRALQFQLGLLTKRGQGRYFRLKEGFVSSISRIAYRTGRLSVFVGIISTLAKILNHIRRFTLNLGLKGKLPSEAEGVWLTASMGIKMARIYYRRLGKALWNIARRLLFIKR